MTLDEMYLSKIEFAREYWAKIAKKHGWSMRNRCVQVWIDENGDFADSIYLPDTARCDYIMSSLMGSDDVVLAVFKDGKRIEVAVVK